MSMSRNPEVALEIGKNLEGVDQHRHFPEIGGLQLAFPQLCGEQVQSWSRK
jgi:hypothetical protein